MQNASLLMVLVKWGLTFNKQTAVGCGTEEKNDF